MVFVKFQEKDIFIQVCLFKRDILERISHGQTALVVLEQKHTTVLDNLIFQGFDDGMVRHDCVYGLDKSIIEANRTAGGNEDIVEGTCTCVRHVLDNAVKDNPAGGRREQAGRI